MIEAIKVWGLVWTVVIVYFAAMVYLAGPI
jgi:hypothetical protein